MKKGKVNFSEMMVIKGAVAAGAVVGAMANKISIIATQEAAIRGGIKLAAGVGAPILAQMFLKKDYKGTIADLVNGFSDGVLAVGAIELANATVFKDAPVSIAGPGFNTIGGYNVVDPSLGSPGFNTIGGASAATGRVSNDPSQY